MKNVVRWIMMVLGLISVTALGAYTGSNPKVPSSVAVLGRQAVAQHLLSQVDSIQIQVAGESIMTPADWNRYYFGHEALEKMGYTFNGSVVELFDIIGRQSFAVDAKAINGRYDIRLEIKFLDLSGVVLLNGSAYFDVTMADNGSLFSNTEPWVWIYSEIDIVMDEVIGYEAHWTDLQYGGHAPVDFMVINEGNGSLIRNFPVSHLGMGYLTVTDRSGNVRVISLINGEIVPHNKVYLYLDQTHSSEVQTVDCVTGNWLPTSNFYQSDGVLYGRVPLLEVVGRGDVVTAEFSVKVWGTDRWVIPDSIIVKSLADGKAVRIYGTTAFRFFNLYLDAGMKYQIIVEFGDKYKDWDADPSPKG